jgi:hypothetical protein
VKERPILFSGAMVRALLDGSKTQTRRVLKKQPYISRTNPPQFSDIEVGDIFIFPDYFPTTPVRGSVIAECKSIGTYHCMGQREFAEKHSPYGVPGDRLWVRETWHAHWGPPTPGARIVTDAAVRQQDGSIAQASADEPLSVHYAADTASDAPFGRKWKPSIHMPRWASRITLEVTGVRVERLQSISDEDARAEGTPCYVCDRALDGDGDADCHCFHRQASASDFRILWDSLNAERGYGWDINPWVWCISFRRV